MRARHRAEHEPKINATYHQAPESRGKGEGNQRYRQQDDTDELDVDLADGLLVENPARKNPPEHLGDGHGRQDVGRVVFANAEAAAQGDDVQGGSEEAQGCKQAKECITDKAIVSHHREVQ